MNYEQTKEKVLELIKENELTDTEVKLLISEIHSDMLKKLILQEKEEKEAKAKHEERIKRLINDLEKMTLEI